MKNVFIISYFLMVFTVFPKHQALAEEAQPSTSCIEVGVDTSVVGRIDCLNLQLRLLAQARHGDMTGANSQNPSLATPAEVGLFNEFGTSERLGSNFGKSAYPQRPPEPQYALPFGAGAQVK